MFCIEILEMIGNDAERIYYIYIEDDMKCEIYTFSLDFQKAK